jgi:hypothetical protein
MAEETVPAWAADLTARLRELEDERRVRDALERYGHSIDYGLEEEWVDCFTPDGVWDVRPGPMGKRGSRRVKCRGRAELAAFIARHTRAPERWHKHVLMDIRVEIHGDVAEATSYFMRVDAHATGPYIRAFGRYRDRLERCDDGRWRMARRIAEIEGTHPLAEAVGNDRPLSSSTPTDSGSA